MKKYLAFVRYNLQYEEAQPMTIDHISKQVATLIDDPNALMYGPDGVSYKDRQGEIRVYNADSGLLYLHNVDGMPRYTNL